MKVGKKTFTVLLIVFAVGFVLGAKQFLLWRTAKQKPISVRTKGDSQAPVKIIEYLDYQCPACARGHSILSSYIKKNPDVFYLQLKYYIFDSHQHSMTAARYMECASRQDKFWELNDLFLERQRYWTDLHDASPAFDQMAGQVGLNVTQLNSCLENIDELDKIIQKDKADGIIAGVRSTPTYFINDETHVGWRSIARYLASYFGEKISAQ